MSNKWTTVNTSTSENALNNTINDSKDFNDVIFQNLKTRPVLKRLIIFICIIVAIIFVPFLVGNVVYIFMPIIHRLNFVIFWLIGLLHIIILILLFSLLKLIYDYIIHGDL